MNNDIRRLFLYYHHVGTRPWVVSSIAIGGLKLGMCVVDEWGNPMTLAIMPNGWEYLVVAPFGSVPFQRTMEALARETRPRL